MLSPSSFACPLCGNVHRDLPALRKHRCRRLPMVIIGGRTARERLPCLLTQAVAVDDLQLICYELLRLLRAGKSPTAAMRQHWSERLRSSLTTNQKPFAK